MWTFLFASVTCHFKPVSGCRRCRRDRLRKEHADAAVLARGRHDCRSGRCHPTQACRSSLSRSESRWRTGLFYWRSGNLTISVFLYNFYMPRSILNVSQAFSNNILSKMILGRLLYSFWGCDQPGDGVEVHDWRSLVDGVPEGSAVHQLRLYHPGRSSRTHSPHGRSFGWVGGDFSVISEIVFSPVLLWIQFLR